MRSSDGKQFPVYQDLFRLSATVHQHEALRAAIRSGLATGLAYFASLMLSAPDVTWAVISALYVLGTSVGGTLNMAIDRVVSTGLGIVLGLGAALLVGSSQTMELLALLLVVGVFGALGEFKADMRYGAVVASILIISLDRSDVFTQALEKAYAISLGSIVGAVVGTFVFPVPAHSSALNHLSFALRDCGKIIKLAFDPEPRHGTEEWDALHSSIERELAIARDRLGQSRWMKRSSRRRPRDILQSVDRLWHHVSMLDRMVSGGARQHSQQQLDLLAQSQKAICGYVDRLAELISSGADPEVLQRDRGELESISGRWREFDDNSSASPRGDQQSAIVAFGWRQLMREIEQIEVAIQTGEK